MLQSYQSRVGLLECFRVVNDLQPTHKDMVRAMGFGGLLHLNFKVSRNGVAYELLRYCAVSTFKAVLFRSMAAKFK